MPRRRRALSLLGVASLLVLCSCGLAVDVADPPTTTTPRPPGGGAPVGGGLSGPAAGSTTSSTTSPLPYVTTTTSTTTTTTTTPPTTTTQPVVVRPAWCGDFDEVQLLSSQFVDASSADDVEEIVDDLVAPLASLAESVDAGVREFAQGIQEPYGRLLDRVADAESPAEVRAALRGLVEEYGRPLTRFFELGSKVCTGTDGQPDFSVIDP